MSATTTTWRLKPKRASRRRLTFTSPTITVLLLPHPTTRAFRSSALENRS